MLFSFDTAWQKSGGPCPPTPPPPAGFDATVARAVYVAWLELLTYFTNVTWRNI